MDENVMEVRYFGAAKNELHTKMVMGGEDWVLVKTHLERVSVSSATVETWMRFSEYMSRSILPQPIIMDGDLEFSTLIGFESAVDLDPLTEKRLSKIEKKVDAIEDTIIDKDISEALTRIRWRANEAMHALESILAEGECSK